MRSRGIHLTLISIAVGACVLLAQPGSATTLLQLDLEQLVDRADKIYRGTVLSARAGTVEAGGGTLPTVTYKIEVDEAFKGDFETVKGRQIAEIRMLGKFPSVRAGNAERVSVIADLPTLEVGKDYLLITTLPSAAGLSTTVGLGQGAFSVFGKAGEELAVNAFRNAGLLKAPAQEEAATQARVARAAAAETAVESSPGPVAYSVLADRIRSLVSAK